MKFFEKAEFKSLIFNNECDNIGLIDYSGQDHHALIITGEGAGGLTGDERIIYDIVAGRMLEAFSPECVKENTLITLDAGGVHFAARGSVTLVPGWRGVFNAGEEADDDEETAALPVLCEGDVLPVREIEMQQKQTKPRPVHTEASLLSAMEGAGKECVGEQEREAMKDSGIGTPATRAAIIETLLAREYVRREKKALVPTEKGLAVYQAVKDKKIADPAMTGAWELALNKIATGQMDAATFHRSIEVYASQITTELLGIVFERKDGRPGCGCPGCKSGRVVFFQKVAKCSNESCGLTVFRTIAGKELTDAQLTALLKKGKTPVIKGFTRSRTGKSFEAAVAFDTEFKTVFAFEQGKKGKGPRGK